MPRFWKKLRDEFGLPGNARKKSQKSRRTLEVESLENREVFAVGVSFGPAPLAEEIPGPALRIDGTHGNDQVIVSWLRNNEEIEVDDQIVVRDQQGIVGRYNIWDWDEYHAEWEVRFLTIEFHGGKGNDSFRINGETPVIDWDAGYWTSDAYDGSELMHVLAYGDEGNDFLEGGNGNDILRGGGGDDQLIGHASSSQFADDLYGDAGNDTLFGDEALKNSLEYFIDYNKTEPEVTGGYNTLDHLYGGDGDDLLISGLAWGSSPSADATDLLVGGAGNDTLDGHRSVMWGDFTADQLAKFPLWAAKSGNDMLIARDRAEMHGGAGNDRITGSNVDFSSYGVLVADVIYGDDGHDTIDAMGGNDQVYGGNGNDVIDGGDGTDKLYGEDGLDTLNGGKGSDTMFGGAMKDKMFGGDGDDAMHGGLGDDEIFGGLGSDFMDGNGGNDYMWGDLGNDLMYGGDGHDQMFGAAGDDGIVGGEGNDTIRGGDGNDRLFGQNGQDALYGETGDDLLDGGIDAFWDLLVGGSGKNTFRADLYGLGGSLKNRDQPLDFNAAKGDTFV